MFFAVVLKSINEWLGNVIVLPDGFIAQELIQLHLFILMCFEGFAKSVSLDVLMVHL